ncbi:MAG TPA: alpha/beta fold hydrolase [Candidatus Dormibacteraeota bacterium]|nr:alpha/beta fold hydrolase [Candidatus Dormibacteraeota bacterium]
MQVESRDLLVTALDGRGLHATLFEPERPRTAVIVSAATATPRGYYRAFAQWLAERGVAVLTYDYRGSGEPPGVLRHSDARMRDWGELDFAGVLAWMKDRYGDRAIMTVGHSFGGHALLLAPNNALVARSVTVACQSGYWRFCAPGERYRVWLLLNVLAPLAMRALGYVPGSRLGLGEDLAGGIMREWRRWCNSPGYFYDDPSMAVALARASTYTAPTLMIGLADDLWATAPAREALAGWYTHAKTEQLVLDPAALGLEPVGHLGFFRARYANTLWPSVTDFLGL